MFERGDGTSAMLVPKEDYAMAKERAALMALDGRRVMVFCDAGVMSRWIATLAERQESRQMQR